MEHAQLIELLNKRVDRHNQKVVAEELGVSQSYLSDVRKSHKMPGPKILNALGLSQRIVYSRKNSA